MQNEGDIAAVVSADIVQAWNGLEPFKKQYRNMRQIFTHYDLTWFFMARKKSNIKSLADLDGKTVGAASVGSSTASFARLYTNHLKKEGIIKDVRLEYMSFTRQADMFVQGRLDALMAYTLAGTEAGWTKSITHRIPWDEINIIPLPEKDFPMLRSKGYPAPLPIRIGDRDTGLVTAGLTGIQIVRDDMDEETVYKVTKCIYDNLKAQGELRNAHAVLKKYAMEDFMNFFVKELPVHKGAARYFKEVGLWRDDLHVAE
jgi:hypothetical protein